MQTVDHYSGYPGSSWRELDEARFDAVEPKSTSGYIGKRLLVGLDFGVRLQSGKRATEGTKPST